VAAVGAAESDGGPEGAQDAVQGPQGGTEAAAGEAGEAGGKDGAPADPRRSAQLRRQQAARAAARERKARDADPARLALRRSVMAEAGIAVVLMAVATTLSGSQPGRAAEEQKSLAAASPAATPSAAPTSLDVTERIPFDTGGPGGKGTATVTLTPARAATDASVHLELADGSGKSIEAPEVRLAFTLPAQHLGPLQAKVAPFGAGHWIADGVRLPLAGDWQMSLTVRTSDIDEVTVTRTVKVGP
jgi:copper transport protein